MGIRCLVIMSVVCGPGAMLAQGGSLGAPPQAGAGSTPSGLLQPSVEVLKQALGTVRVEKWKGASAVKEEADRNVGSIQRDLDSTLPGLLATADAAPDSAAKMLPAYRNVEALYDVLLRIEAVSRVAAPADQSSALAQALTSLDTGRRSLGDRLQADAAAQEKRAGDLQAALKVAQAAPVAASAPAPVCPAPAPAKKKKPAVKPSTPQG